MVVVVVRQKDLFISSVASWCLHWLLTGVKGCSASDCVTTRTQLSFPDEATLVCTRSRYPVCFCCSPTPNK